MPAAFLHGIETVEIDDGIRPIETVKSSIIGLIGTAPDSTLIVKNSLMVRTEPPGAQRRFDAGRVGGGGGIRTHGGVTPTSVFKTGALNHSATPPGARQLIVAVRRGKRNLRGIRFARPGA